MRTSNRNRKWNGNSFVGLSGARSYFVVRFGFSWSALSSFLLALVAVTLGIFLVRVVGRKNKKL